MTIQTLTKNWNGRELREVVKYGEKTLKIVTGLKNGNRSHNVYILGNEGWHNFISTDETGMTFDNGASYVSDENERLEWAGECNKALKIGIENILGV